MARRGRQRPLRQQSPVTRAALRSRVLVILLAVACASESSYLKKGRQLAAERQYDAAIKQFMLALSENPNSVQANLEIGRVYVALKRSAEAVKAIQQARKGGETEEVLVALAGAYYQQKDLRQAATCMEQALKLAPQSAEDHYHLGLIRRDLGDLAHAVDSFQTAIGLNPKMSEARVELGLALKDLKRTDEAIDVLKIAAKDLYDSGRPLANVQAALAQAYEASAMLDYALHTYGLALKIDPTCLPALTGTGRVLIAQSKLEEAIAFLADALKKVPKDQQLYLLLGLAYRDYHLDSQAIDALLHAIEPPAAQSAAYMPLLDLLNKTKAAPELIAKILDQAASALLSDFDLQLRSGDAANDRKDFARAVQAYKRAVEIQPANVEATIRLITAQARSGDFDAARQNCAVLRVMNPAKADELTQMIDKLTAPKPLAPIAPPSTAKDKSKKPVKHTPKRGR
jgi:tetratricopeptide (TPR) repeat protein